MVLEDIHALIDCPVLWYELTGDSEFTFCMRAMWYAKVCEHQVDCESSYLNAYDFELNKLEELLGGPEEWEPDLKNITSWIGRARDEYLSFARRFTELRAATAADYPKHYGPPGSTDDDLRRLSRGGVSMLRPVFDPEAQLAAAWDVLRHALETEVDIYGSEFDAVSAAKVFSSVLGSPGLQVDVEMRRVTGYAFGMPTTTACFDFDFSTPLLHVYPITSAEAEASGHIFVSIQGWNYIFDPETSSESA